MLLERIDGYAKGNGLFYLYEKEGRRMEYTYAQLKADSDRLAAYILSHYPDQNRPAIIWGHKSPWMVTSFMACAKAGLAYCPLDTTMPLDRVRRIVEETQADLVICLDGVLPLEGALTEADLKVIFESGPPLEGGYRMKDEDIFYIIFTSGSTGQPKGVQISYKNLQAYVDWALTLVPDDPHAVYMNQAPFSFDLSVMDLYLSLASGSSLFILDNDCQASYRRLMEAFRTSKISVWVSTPSFADYCLAEKQFNDQLLPKLKTFLFCGEILKNQTVSALMDRFPQADIINTYGPTESTVCVTSIRVTRDLLETYNPLPIGMPKPGTKLLIDKADPSDHGGEILILGDTVSPGYYKRPQLNRQVFSLTQIDGQAYPTYRTGDLGYEEGGLFFCTGRADAQIKLHGYRMELGDIEKNLLKIQGVRQAVVLPTYKEGVVEWLTAYLVLDEKPQKPLRKTIALKQALRAYVMDYMVPKRFVYMDQIPMTHNGKVDRRALEQMDQ